MEQIAELLATAAAVASPRAAWIGSRLGTLRNHLLDNSTTILCLAILVLASCAFSQPGADANGEFSLMTGAALGGMGTHPIVVGSAGAALSRFTMVTVDAGAMPAGRDTLLPAIGLASSGSDLFTFGVAMQGRIPIRRWEPYVLLEPALLVNSYRAVQSSGSGTVIYSGNRHSKFGLELGAGIRYYVKPKWGVRAEYRYVSSAKNFTEVKTGVFYQIEGYSGFHFRRNFNRLLSHLSDGDRDRVLQEISAH